jgi:AcrR family transcriptional regulator
MRDLPPQRSKVNKERTRAAILDAATRLFAARGPESVTFADLARSARISRSLIYFHFKSRDTLFHEVVARANQMLYARFANAVAGRASGLDQILAIGQAYRNFFFENPREFALMACYQARSPGSAAQSAAEDRIAGLHRAIMELMTTVLKRGRRDGSLRRDLGDPLATALCLWAFTHGLLQVSSAQGCEIERTHGVKPEKLVDFGFGLLRAGMENRRS